MRAEWEKKQDQEDGILFKLVACALMLGLGALFVGCAGGF